ncbi:MAG: hypothetical protein HC881_24350 [Leptolyngbyaceae cyanobacterium SL_7_1]|nr:hypothetical protein [Leptolyngbyaceae cyanobacterium SL_7_1]
MIHHISLAAHDPLRVARVLAELFQGQVVPFPNHPGSYVAVAFDPHGTIVEVHPHGTGLVPGVEDEGVQHVHNLEYLPYTATHVAISVPVSEAQIREIAAWEGWRVGRFRRSDFFEVIELWLENQVLIELLPPMLAAQYFDFTQPQELEQYLAAAASSRN